MNKGPESQFIFVADRPDGTNDLPESLQSALRHVMIAERNIEIDVSRRTALAFWTRAKRAEFCRTAVKAKCPSHRLFSNRYCLGVNRSSDRVPLS
jgi:hypothetical protein